MINPYKILNYNIYDVFYNTNEKNYVLIGYQNIINFSYNIYLIIDNIKYKFNVYVCSHGHSLIYTCNNNIKLDKISLLIENNLLETNVNFYEEYPDEIIMSTLILNENAYIKQWIKYNLILGINRFIIYDNNVDKDEELTDILSEYIEKNIVILIKWDYDYDKKAQPTQQNHSLYVYKSSKYIGFFDVDEYINPQIPKFNLDILFNEIILFNNFNLYEIGSFRLLCKIFVNTNNQSEDDFNFLDIYNCHNICYHGREKNFIIPKNVNIFCIHVIVDGKQMVNISENLIYFNHYMFLNKNDRCRNYLPESYDNTIINIKKFCLNNVI